jgi:hypothetical protein
MLRNILILISLALGHSGLLAEKTDLSVSEQLAQLRKENLEMKQQMETYRDAVLSAGGPRIDQEKKKVTKKDTETSFAEVEESTDDPTIQCQTICKFVRPAAGQ